MDDPALRRLKIDGTAEVVAADGEASEVERVFWIRVEAFDWNCPQCITPRFTAAQVEEQLLSLRERIAQREEALQVRGKPTRMRTVRFVAFLAQERPIHLLEIPRSARSIGRTRGNEGRGLLGSPQQG